MQKKFSLGLFLLTAVSAVAQQQNTMSKLTPPGILNDMTKLKEALYPSTDMELNNFLPFTISTVAGSGAEKNTPGSTGDNDGPGRTAKFNQPFDIICDAKGNFIIADFLNYRIRKMSPEGNVTTIAGSSQGQEDGSLATARLWSPTAVCFDKDGSILVVDKNYNAIRRITGSKIETIAGGNGDGFENGDAKESQFNGPSAIAVNSKGEIFVCDEGNHVIRKISGNTVSTYAGNGNGGHADGPAAEADFLYPQSIAIDSEDNIYVTEGTTVRKITVTGMVTTVAGNPEVQGRRDGKGSAASFSKLSDIAIGPSGKIYVVDNGTTDALSDDHAINVKYKDGGAAIRVVDPSGLVQTIAGGYLCTRYADYMQEWRGKDVKTWPLIDGPVSAAFLSYSVMGICVDKNENIYVVDTWYNCVRRISQ